jgi:HMG box factor, other
MNPPSTPGTPMSAQIGSIRSPYADSILSLNRTAHGAKEVNGRLMSPVVKSHDEADRRVRHWDIEENGTVALDAKRRRLTASGFRRASRGDISPIVESYAGPQQRTYVSRPSLAHLREHYHMLPPLRACRSPEESRFHDPSLTLPPLQTTSPRLQNQRDVEATVMTIPFINKIKVLAKISPPLLNRPTSTSSPTRGAVIAVDGQEPALVNSMVRYLGTLLTKEGKYTVRVFEGPEVHLHQGTSKAGEMEDATMDYLNIISVWHRISGEIVQFINPVSKNVGSKVIDDSSSDLISPTSTVPKAHMQKDSASGEAGQTASKPIPIALVPRYQLTTADLFACAIPINDSYAPLDHWQWMASLWRGCVGPDVTVYIRECEKEEVDRHGGGNPVEVRLSDARTIVTRRTQSSPKEIEEKALRRVGFEIVEFLTR